MDGEGAVNDANYAYFQREFVAFYDQMVLECYGGTSAPDVQAYASLLEQQLQAAAAAAQGQPVVAVDLGCGSGRAILAFLERLALLERPDCKLHLYGVDNSPVFLEAARVKCSAFLEQHPSLQQWVSITWILGSFEDWEFPQPAAAGSLFHQQQQQQHTKADFILVAGAGLHHVMTTAGLRAALQHIVQQLAPTGLAVISYLPWAELYRTPNTHTLDTPALASGSAATAGGISHPSGHIDSTSSSSLMPRHGLSVEEFSVQGYKRVLLYRSVKQHDDGSCVLTEHFALSNLAGDGPEGGREGRCTETGAGGPGFEAGCGQNVHCALSRWWEMGLRGGRIPPPLRSGALRRAGSFEGSRRGSCWPRLLGLACSAARGIIQGYYPWTLY